MAALVDYQIKTLAKAWKIVSPYRDEQLNPASYDVTVGPTLLVEKPPHTIEEGIRIINDRWVEVNLFETPYKLKPGQFALACTAEVLRIPNDIEAVFCLKSSRGREGWEHALAGYIDPGFEGRVTLELKNNNQYHDLDIFAGLRIGQIRFSQLTDTPNKPYGQTGRYHGDMKTTPSKG